MAKDKKNKKRYDMLRDMMGPGTLEKPTQESTLPKFFKFVPDPYTATDKMMDKIKKKSKKKKAGGMVKKTKTHRGDGIAKRGRTRGRIV